MDRREYEHQAIEHFDAVYRMAYHLTGSHQKAEDLTQDVYVRALRPGCVESFSPHGGGMKSFLLVICHNAHYSNLKKSARDGATVIADFDPPDHRAQAGHEGQGRAAMDWEHVDERLKRAIEDLPEDFRVALLLWAVDRLKYREIAQILGVRIGTVMSRLFRARQALADALGRSTSAEDCWKPPRDNVAPSTGTA
ncbi:MAG: RNA polymerase sigma factor [Phycisphaeraceae bacterium]|nr:RNA polymerase sigma factor [Phycisphaeraceae bacterium]HRJ49761.1 RNA polymerase sigma factor [Phycisphaerales bacterium]